jgi:hypothetical protein
MKKLVMMLVVMAMAAPLMAGDVQFTATTNGLTVTVDYVATGGTIRGMALNVGADVNIESVVVDSFWDVFMDAAYMDPDNYGLGDGTPIANPAQAGEVALPLNAFCISVGNLEGTETAPELALTAAGPGTGTLDINTLRGAIVDTDGNEMTSNLPIPLEFLGGVTPCPDRFTGDEKTDYDAYVAAGADPSCWCWQFQCHGDTGNATQQFQQFRVYTNDIADIVSNWKAKIDTADPCADIDHVSQQFQKFRVYTDDIAIVVANWKAKDVALTDCPAYIAP